LGTLRGLRQHGTTDQHLATVLRAEDSMVLTTSDTMVDYGTAGSADTIPWTTGASGGACHTSQQEPAQNALVTEDGFELRFTLRRSATGN